MVNQFRAVGCFVHVGDKFLTLHRIPSDGDCWALPGGGVDEGEDDSKTILRELEEELGKKFSKDQLEFLGEWNWHILESIVEYPTFRIRLDKKFQVKLDPKEHDDYLWVTAQEYFDMCNTHPGTKELLWRIGYIQRNGPYVESRMP
ncbi:NUDIX hydrolase [Candidatus Woesearchaeota archaeon]|nr:NUDIX hydrolase [Candidatus Woesearchaeota archaeon]